MTTAADGVGVSRGGPLAGRFGPWLWGPGVDLAAFGGSALLSLLFAVGIQWGVEDSENVPLPDWAWFVCILGVDVAHVYSTLFRTYLDGQELRRHPLRYWALPVALLIGLWWLRQQGGMAFWRVLAYLAVFHFVRQQVGWAAVYRSRAHQGWLDRWVDEVAIYLVTLYPVLWWHAHLEGRNFAWFAHGDFVPLASQASSWLNVLGGVTLVASAAFLARQLQLFRQRRVVYVGKCIVVLSTALLWNVGIVWTNTDVGFTLTNVLAHGIPYMVLLWFYGKARAQEAPQLALSGVVRTGAWAFATLLWVLALAEEFFWDRAVNFERDWLFGDGLNLAPASDELQSLAVAFLALPQVLHYALDGVLWRRAEAKSRPAQRSAIGA